MQLPLDTRKQEQTLPLPKAPLELGTCRDSNSFSPICLTPTTARTEEGEFREG